MSALWCFVAGLVLLGSPCSYFIKGMCYLLSHGLHRKVKSTDNSVQYDICRVSTALMGTPVPPYLPALPETNLQRACSCHPAETSPTTLTAGGMVLTTVETTFTDADFFLQLVKWCQQYVSNGKMRTGPRVSKICAKGDYFSIFARLQHWWSASNRYNCEGDFRMTIQSKNYDHGFPWSPSNETRHHAINKRSTANTTSNDVLQPSG